MSLQTLTVTENYSALNILRFTQLTTAMTSIETWAATTNLDITQLAKDVFGSSYVFNNDGVQTLATALMDSTAKLADNETVQGSWTFSNTVAFDGVVTSTSTFTSSGQMRAKAYKLTSNQSIPDATATAITLNTEAYDVGSLHDTATNTSRLTIPSGGAGIYDFHGQATFAVNATGRREIYIYKNGSEVARTVQLTASASVQSLFQVSFQDTANVSDYYEMFVYQNSGGALDVVQGANVTYFSGMKVW